jgi:spermidine/putrescine transport system permease protein
MVLFPAMTIFYIPNILGGAKSILLGNLIENQFFVLDNWPGGSATSLFLSLFMILGLFLTQYKRNEK